VNPAAAESGMEEAHSYTTMESAAITIVYNPAR
jgi:hypothetical protein